MTFFKLLLEPVSLHGRLHCEPGWPLPDTDCPHGLPLKLLQLSLSTPCLPLGHAPPEHSSPFQGFVPNASLVSCLQTFPSHHCGSVPGTWVRRHPLRHLPSALNRPMSLSSDHLPCLPPPLCPFEDPSINLRSWEVFLRSSFTSRPGKPPRASATPTSHLLYLRQHGKAGCPARSGVYQQAQLSPVGKEPTCRECEPVRLG